MKRTRGTDTDALLAELERRLPAVPEEELRTMARKAASRSRPLPRPLAQRGGLSTRGMGVVAIALAVAVGLGIGVGTLLAPTGTAAPRQLGTGFLPGPGWTVLQTGEDPTFERQALAVASNVPLQPEDAARGIRGSSGLPYSTLLGLPEDGVVIVGLFTRRESEPWNDEFFPKRTLPLRVRDAASSISYSYQMRPERPLGQYELRATVGEHRVMLHFYFGTKRPSPALLAVAQRQLDGLVVGSVSAGGESATRSPAAVRGASKVIDLGAPGPGASAPLRIVDRTVACSVVQGNPREITVRAQTGTRVFGDRSTWKFRANASFSDPTATRPGTYAWITAGWPPDEEFGRPASTVSLAITTRCRPSRSRVPLSSAGLSGGVASSTVDDYDCVVPRTILVRIRGVFRAPTSLRPRLRGELAARGPIREGILAIRTRTGRQIALATVSESGPARLFVADSCRPSS